MKNSPPFFSMTVTARLPTTHLPLSTGWGSGRGKPLYGSEKKRLPCSAPFSHFLNITSKGKHICYMWEEELGHLEMENWVILTLSRRKETSSRQKGEEEIYSCQQSWVVWLEGRHLVHVRLHAHHALAAPPSQNISSTAAHMLPAL